MMKYKLCIVTSFLSFLFCWGQEMPMQQEPEAPYRQLELFCGATLGYADTNWLRLYDVQINATPGLRWHPGHDWEVAAQVAIPVVSLGYTYRNIIYKYNRLNMATVGRQLHFDSANQYLRVTVGLFSNQCYGADVRWAWPVNSWLLLNSRLGLISYWVMGTEFCGKCEATFHSDYKLIGTVGVDVYLRPYNVEFRLSGGRYIAGDYGSQLDVMRHFRHFTLLAFAQLRIGELEANPYDKKKYRTNGGFAIVWMLPPYNNNHQKSSRNFVVRPASNFILSHSSRAEGQPMRTYSVDPEENSRERLIDVDWGLGKKVTPDN